MSKIDYVQLKLYTNNFIGRGGHKVEDKLHLWEGEQKMSSTTDLGNLKTASLNKPSVNICVFRLLHNYH
jgi:hypothetical protein